LQVYEDRIKRIKALGYTGERVELIERADVIYPLEVKKELKEEKEKMLNTINELKLDIKAMKLGFKNNKHKLLKEESERKKQNIIRDKQEKKLLHKSLREGTLSLNVFPYYNAKLEVTVLIDKYGQNLISKFFQNAKREQGRYFVSYLEFPSSGWSSRAKHKPLPTEITLITDDVVFSGKSIIVNGNRRLKLNLYDRQKGKWLQGDYSNIPMPLQYVNILSEGVMECLCQTETETV